MTEAEWQVGSDVIEMITALNIDRTDRKLQLYLVACGQQLDSLFPYQACKTAISAKANYLEGDITKCALQDAALDAESAVYNLASNKPVEYIAEWLLKSKIGVEKARGLLPNWDGQSLTNEFIQLFDSTTYFASTVASIELLRPFPHLLVRHRQFLSISLLRDIFGNPFRPVVFYPEWRSSDVMALAQSMYTSRDFDPMPILADALEEAGCDSDDILAHCRGAGPHVRGCWVVDLVLGKS